ncbi:putative bifunctional diguanylate cyclase/phosphodiesterase [Pseudonocardia nigra]|uniref:putative bifunctional diguanylate cyclase/phosphodiesterase n=1 Tax=Pseudonocardia nigra TaxID=1921578 RepID=UPI001C5F4224|nr:EAL domain-containing protein [Pseudonocardia nigra]
MVAPRSLSGPLDGHSGLRAAAEACPPGPGGIERLAGRWAQLAPTDDPGIAAHLATVLRKLATTLRAEPFWPLAARELGAELLTTGLCGDPEDPVEGGPEDVLAPSLRLLRREAAAVLGPSGPDADRRLAAALDELVAGVVGALHERRRRNGVRAPGAAAVAGERSVVLGERQLRALYEQAPVGIGIARLDGWVIDINPALSRLFGLEGPVDQPRPVSDFVHPEDMVDVVEHLQRLARGEPEVVRMEVRLVRVDSQVVWAHVVASRMHGPDGEPTHLMAVVEEISDHQRLRSRLQESSYQDQLTRLPNQAVTEQWLHRAFAADGPGRVGMCAIDLDSFHPINDALGTRIGDRLLLAVASRLQLTAGDHLVSRTGTDEFAVLVAEPDGIAEVSRLADRLQAAMATPFHIDGHTLVVSASIGVAEAYTAEGSAGELRRAADVARSWAKALGGGRRVVFDPERDAAESARFALLSGLRGAIGRGEFRLVFQPLVQLTDGRVAGAEALVRWQHPEQGLIGPGQFIELAEQSGAIVPLGRWVLEAACAQAASWWRELGPDAPFVSVNVSPVQLAEPGWVSEVTGVLASTGLPADRLQLEITEQAVLGDELVVLDALSALRAVGVRLALDDFGTGYSSLAWLRRLPVHALKIDGSFIDGLRNASADPTDSSIVRALVEMAHALGLEVTAEWVETAVQAERLERLGCDIGQGRWFGDAGPGEWVPELSRRSISEGGHRLPSAPR